MAKLSTLAARQIAKGEILRCDQVKGLQLWGKATGAVWFLYYRTPAGERRPKLGTYPEIGIDAAREAAKAMLRRITLDGIDPAAERAAARSAVTMNELFARYISEHAPKRTDASTIREYRQRWAKHVAPKVGKMKAVEFVKADAERVLSAAATPREVTKKRLYVLEGVEATKTVKTGGPVTANRVRALLSGVLAFAQLSDVLIRPAGSNFMAETTKAPEHARRRHITTAEFQRINAALGTLAPKYPAHVAAIRCTLYCATRVSELLSARRDWLEGSLLHLDKHKTARKTGAPRVIRLPRQAVELIEGLKLDADGLLFGPGVDRFRIWDVWCEVRTLAGCEDIQPRDLRRTFASVAKTLGSSLDDIGELLGHAGDNRVTAGYAYLFEDAAQDRAQSVADEIDRLSKGDGQ
jgi:integrase